MSGRSRVASSMACSAGPGLAHHLEATVEPQRDAHQPAHVRDVVDQQHPDGHGVAAALGRRTMNAFSSGR